MMRHNVVFSNNESRFIPLSIFHFYRILMLMIRVSIKQFLFHLRKIRAAGYSTLSVEFVSVSRILVTQKVSPCTN